MNPAYKALLIGVATAVLTVSYGGGAFIFGRHHERAMQAIDQLKTARLEFAAYQRGLADGQAAVELLQVQLRGQKDDYDQLQTRFDDLRRQGVPLTVARPAAACPAPVRIVAAPVPATAGSAAPARGVELSPAGTGPGIPAQSDQAGSDSPELSLGAVRLWNSALAGRDVPAGACGAAGAADAQETAGAAAGSSRLGPDQVEACSRGSGLTVDDAWTNHLDNARSEAADALRHQRLIDFIQQRQSDQVGQPSTQ